MHNYRHHPHHEEGRVSASACSVYLDIPNQPPLHCNPGHHHHHHSNHRHHRQYHHHLVARHVVMHQVRGIGMMQYITKMMKTKYLGGFSVMIQ